MANPAFSPAQSSGADEPLLQIGEAAEAVGLSLRTVRYYEEVGLITPVGRTPGGFRLYSGAEVERLGVLKAMKPFGLTLEEIRELMDVLDRTQDASALAADDRAALTLVLEQYADRAGRRVAVLEAHADEVRRMRERLVGRIDQLGG